MRSKVGSLDNVKHKPGGGDKKIFDDKDYLKQIAQSGDNSKANSVHTSGSQVRTILSSHFSLLTVESSRSPEISRARSDKFSCPALTARLFAAYRPMHSLFAHIIIYEF